LERGKHRVFPVHYDPGKKLFHVVVKLSDAPGSYRSVLDLLSSRVNLIGTSTYTLSDGTAMFSGFAEALSPKETAERIKKLILGSKVAIEAEVHEGSQGLLIDTFHNGFVVDTEAYVLLRKGDLAHMFDRVSRILGSGGDTLLYEEGRAMSHWNVESLAKKFGIKRFREEGNVLYRFMSAQGWGEVNGKPGPEKGEFTMTVKDCFECSGEGAPRRECSFMRGYFAGSANAIYGREFEVRETKCGFKGEKFCEFRITPEG
jgi:predicted hydrocarbon binding protein